MRGFSVIALDYPKTPTNVGSALRAAHIYGASLVIISGKRYQRSPTDVTKAWRHLPLLQVEEVFDAIPYDCVPIAVDLVPKAKPLPYYRHPERACYIFGPEDSTLGKRILDRCRDRVMIPMNGCEKGSMNLACAVNVVLYDRLAKSMAPWSNGKTLDFDSRDAGSIPAGAAILNGGSP